MGIQSGWNLGWPDIKPQESAKHLTGSETIVNGSGPVKLALPLPASRLGFYRDIAVLAYHREDTSSIAPISDLRQKAAFDEVSFSATDTRHLLETAVSLPGKGDRKSTRLNSSH